MTQDLYQKAMKFAGEKHGKQLVPGTNANYLLHLSNVAIEVLCAYSAENSFDINFAVQVAILHDTIEDTDTEFEEIEEIFGNDIASAVQALTKDDQLSTKTERMLDSLNRINALPKEVGLVKIADRITNLQTPPPHWSKSKVINYCEEAQLILDSLKNKNTYLEKRLKSKIAEYKQQIAKL